MFQFTASGVTEAWMYFMHASLLTAGIVMALHAWDIEKAAGYGTAIEVAAGVAVTMLYAGSYAGLFVAALAAFELGLYLRVVRWWRGFKRLERHGLRLVWVYRPY